jgi:hypothetical protein
MMMYEICCANGYVCEGDVCMYVCMYVCVEVGTTISNFLKKNLKDELATTELFLQRGLRSSCDSDGGRW